MHDVQPGSGLIGLVVHVTQAIGDLRAEIQGIGDGDSVLGKRYDEFILKIFGKL